MKNKPALGSRLKTLRLEYGISQSDFGNYIGISYVAVANIEKGVTLSPQMDTMKKIVEVYGTTSEWLNEGKGEMLPEGKRHLIKTSDAENNPYKDYAIQRLEKEADTWQQKYNQLFEMFSRYMDRSSAKHKATELAGLNFRKVNRSVARA